MNTKPIVESLLFHSNNIDHLETAFRLARIINDDNRYWTPENHPELDVHLSHFKEPTIVITIGLVISVFLIVDNPNNLRIKDVITIEGKESYISEMSKSKIVLEANASLNIRDFMPLGSLKQIIWIPFKEREYENVTSEMVEEELLMGNTNVTMGERKIEAIMFTENIRGEWMLDNDISSPDPKYSSITTQREILRNLIEEV